MFEWFRRRRSGRQRLRPDGVRRLAISYSHKDADIVGPIVKLLRATGAPVFRDVEDIALGQKWREAIQESIAAADALILFWSCDAAESAEVRKEWQAAIALKKSVIPVNLDSTPLPKTLENYQGVSFGRILGPPPGAYPEEWVLRSFPRFVWQLATLISPGLGPDAEAGWRLLPDEGDHVLAWADRKWTKE